MKTEEPKKSQADLKLERLEKESEEKRKSLLKFQIVIETGSGEKQAGPVLAIYSDMSKADFKDVWKNIGKVMWEKVQHSRGVLADEDRKAKQEKKPSAIQTTSESEAEQGRSDPAHLPGSPEAREGDEGQEVPSKPLA